MSHEFSLGVDRPPCHRTLNELRAWNHLKSSERASQTYMSSWLTRGWYIQLTKVTYLHATGLWADFEHLLWIFWKGKSNIYEFVTHTFVMHTINLGNFDWKKTPPPGGFPIYYFPSSRTVCKRTPLEGFVKGSSRRVLLHTVLDEGT